MNEDLKKLVEISKTLRDCNQEISRTSLRSQFRYETGYYPSDSDVAKILGKESRG